MAPNAQKLRRVLFADFGVLLGALPEPARFHARKKAAPNGGDGRGSQVLGPSDWEELGKFLDTLQYIRNAAAHGDATKLGKCPADAEGLLWLRKANGGWSVQQPHALTALRATVAAFNATAVALAGVLGLVSPALTAPDAVDYPPSAT